MDEPTAGRAGKVFGIPQNTKSWRNTFPGTPEGAGEVMKFTIIQSIRRNKPSQCLSQVDSPGFHRWKIKAKLPQGRTAQTHTSQGSAEGSPGAGSWPPHHMPYMDVFPSTSLGNVLSPLIQPQIITLEIPVTRGP